MKGLLPFALLLVLVVGLFASAVCGSKDEEAWDGEEMTYLFDEVEEDVDDEEEDLEGSGLLETLKEKLGNLGNPIQSLRNRYRSHQADQAEKKKNDAVKKLKAERMVAQEKLDNTLQDGLKVVREANMKWFLDPEGDQKPLPESPEVQVFNLYEKLKEVEAAKYNKKLLDIVGSTDDPLFKANKW